MDPKFPARSPNFSSSQAHNPVAQHQQNHTTVPPTRCTALHSSSQGERDQMVR